MLLLDHSILRRPVNRTLPSESRTHRRHRGAPPESRWDIDRRRGHSIPRSNFNRRRTLLLGQLPSRDRGGRRLVIRLAKRRVFPHPAHEAVGPGHGELWLVGKGGFRPGEDLSCLLAHDRTTLDGQEADDQADFLLRASYLVPRDPGAVGVAQFGLAIMGGKLLWRNHVLAIRPGISLVACGLVESVDNQRSVHLDRLLTLFVIEHQATAESPRRGPVGSMEHGVGPHGHDFARLCGLAVLVRHPRNSAIQIDLCAAKHGGP